MIHKYTFNSPIGELTLYEELEKIVGLLPKEQGERKFCGYACADGQTDLLYEACIQLKEYFSGKRTEFNLPLAPKGTAFQQRVWGELCKIPYGKTVSYQDLAEKTGNPKAQRAVGSANGKNPIIIIIPCHRIISKSGKIGGYSCGVDVKRYLLKSEGIILNGKGEGQ